MAVTFHTAAHYLVAALSLAAYFAFVAGYCLAPPDSVSLLSKTDPVYQVFFQARARPRPPPPARARRLGQPVPACAGHARARRAVGSLCAGHAGTCSLKPCLGAQHEKTSAAFRAACQAVRGTGARRAADAAPGGARRAQLVYLPGFWLGLAGGVAACLLPDLAIMVLRRTLAPFDFQIVQARPAPHMHAPLWPGRRRNPRQRSHISHM